LWREPQNQSCQGRPIHSPQIYLWETGDKPVKFSPLGRRSIAHGFSRGNPNCRQAKQNPEGMTQFAGRRKSAQFRIPQVKRLAGMVVCIPPEKTLVENYVVVFQFFSINPIFLKSYIHNFLEKFMIIFTKIFIFL